MPLVQVATVVALKVLSIPWRPTINHSGVYWYLPRLELAYRFNCCVAVQLVPISTATRTACIVLMVQITFAFIPLGISGTARSDVSKHVQPSAQRQVQSLYFNRHVEVSVEFSSKIKPQKEWIYFTFK